MELIKGALLVAWGLSEDAIPRASISIRRTVKMLHYAVYLKT
jgi:hypothetical protein